MHSEGLLWLKVRVLCGTKKEGSLINISSQNRPKKIRAYVGHKSVETKGAGKTEEER